MKSKALWVSAVAALTNCVATLIMLDPSTASAQSRDENVARCNSGVPDTVITGCSALIQSGSTQKNNLAEAYYNRGRAYYDKDQYDLAIQDFDQAIRTAPKQATKALTSMYTNRGLAYSKKRQDDRAIQDYNEAIRLDPNNWIAFANRGQLYARARDADNAIRDFDRVILLNPNFAPIHVSRGLIYYFLKVDMDQAIRDFDEAIKLDPRSANVYCLRGRAKRMNHDPAGAASDIARAKQLDPNTCK